MKIAITGATGFIGSRLVDLAESRGHTVLPVARKDLWKAGVLLGADATIHLAAIAHSKASETEVEEVNHSLTKILARQARAAGCKRFVFVSSVAAGQETSTYGKSKAAAERAIQNIVGLEPVIVRPPLVYGARAKGSFGLLLKAAKSPFPLPFRNAHNLRSMVYLDNLCDALIFCCTTKTIAPGPHVLTDGMDLTVEQIVKELRSGRGAGLISAPWLPSMLSRLGKGRMADQLFSPLTFRNELGETGWQPPYSPLEALRRTASGV